jgi:streptogramin lyase
VNLPQGFSYSNAAWKSYVLPSLQPGNYSWHAMVVDASTAYLLSESKAPWVFKAG